MFEIVTKYVPGGRVSPEKRVTAVDVAEETVTRDDGARLVAPAPRLLLK
jgi:hypothetical protein